MKCHCCGRRVFKEVQSLYNFYEANDWRWKKKGGKKERERDREYNNNNNNEVNVFWAPRVTAKVPSSNTLNKIVFIASPTSVYRVQWRHCRFSNVKTIKQNRNLCRDGGKITGRNRNQRCAIVVYHVWCIPNSIYSSVPRLFLTETDKVEERKFWWSLLPDKWCQNEICVSTVLDSSGVKGVVSVFLCYRLERR